MLLPRGLFPIGRQRRQPHQTRGQPLRRGERGDGQLDVLRHGSYALVEVCRFQQLDIWITAHQLEIL